MSQAFIQIAIPVLYVYDPEHLPDEAPGFDMNLLPVISRVLKEHAGTRNVTVITGTPTLVKELDTAFTHLALQYPKLTKASPDAGNLILAELATENFDPESVTEHLRRFIAAREEGARDIVRSRYGHGEGQEDAAVEGPEGESATDETEGDEPADDDRRSET